MEFEKTKWYRRKILVIPLILFLLVTIVGATVYITGNYTSPTPVGSPTYFTNPVNPSNNSIGFTNQSNDEVANIDKDTGNIITRGNITSNYSTGGYIFSNFIGTILNQINWLRVRNITSENINNTQTINTSGQININNNPVSIWLYNQSDGSFNSSYLVNTDQRYNETLTITNMNASWLSTYNITYAGYGNGIINDSNANLSSLLVSQNLSVLGNFSVSNNSLFVNGATGRVGIGTTTPQYDLDIGKGFNGTILFKDSGSTYAGENLGSILFYNDDPSTSGIGRRIGGALKLIASDEFGKSRMAISSGTNDPITVFGQTASYYDNSTERISILNTGQVGIGTITPTQLLDVRGAGNFSSTIYINNGTDISNLNETLTITNMNASWLSTYNVSYDSIYDNGIINDSNANLSSLKIARNLTVTGNLTSETGFFSSIGSSLSRVTKGWFTNVDVSNTLNASGNISLGNGLVTREGTNASYGITSSGQIVEKLG